MDTSRLAFFFTVLIAVMGLAGTWAVYGDNITDNTNDIGKLDTRVTNVEKDNIEHHTAIETIKQDVQYTRQAVSEIKASQVRQESVNYEILKKLQHLGAANTTADAPHVGGRAVMRSSRDGTE